MLIGGELEAAGNDDINFSFQKLLIQILEWQTFGMKICELLFFLQNIFGIQKDPFQIGGIRKFSVTLLKSRRLWKLLIPALLIG